MGAFDAPPTSEEIKKAKAFQTPPSAEELAAAKGSAPAPAPITGTQSFGYGAAKGATLNWDDELAGLGGAGAAGITEDSSLLGMMSPFYTILKSYMKDPEKAKQGFNTAQLDWQGRSEAARAANPGKFKLGEIVGGVAPAAGGQAILGPAAAGWSGAARLGAGLGAAGGLGESKKDTLGHALDDTLAGGVVGVGAGLAGQGIATGVGAGARAAHATFGESITRALNKALDSIGYRRGDPELLRAGAGTLMSEAKTAAGDMPIPLNNYLRAASELQSQAETIIGRPVSPQESKVISDLTNLIKTRGDAPYANLNEVGRALESIGGDLKTLPEGSQGRRMYTKIFLALKQDLQDASKMKPEEFTSMVQQAQAAKQAVGKPDWLEVNPSTKGEFGAGAANKGPAWEYQPGQEQSLNQMIDASKEYAKASAAGELIGANAEASSFRNAPRYSFAEKYTNPGVIYRDTADAVAGNELGFQGLKYPPKPSGLAEGNFNQARTDVHDMAEYLDLARDKGHWQDMLNVARSLITPGKQRFLPQQIPFVTGLPNVGFKRGAFNNLFTYARLGTLIKDPEFRATFKALIDNGIENPERGAQLLAQLTSAVQSDAAVHARENVDAQAMPWLTSPQIAPYR